MGKRLVTIALAGLSLVAGATVLGGCRLSPYGQKFARDMATHAIAEGISHEMNPSYDRGGNSGPKTLEDFERENQERIRRINQRIDEDRERKRRRENQEPIGSCRVIVYNLDKGEQETILLVEKETSEEIMRGYFSSKIRTGNFPKKGYMLTAIALNGRYSGQIILTREEVEKELKNK